MTKTSTITFATLRHLLEKLGYRQLPAKKGHIFHQSEEREIYFRPYGDREFVFARDLAKARSFLDNWNQLEAADFDAFLDSTTRPA